MKAHEFTATLGADRTIAVPEGVAAQVRAGQPVRVLLLVEEPTEDQEWARMAAAEFSKGYAPGDAIYDRLTPGTTP